MEERYKFLETEWDHKKNTRKLSDCTKGSHYVAHWTHICKCGERHEWTQVVKQRILRKDNCPYCSKIPKKLCKCRSLAYCYPEVAKQWHPTKNKKTPEQVFAKAQESVWWLCPYDKCSHKHEWKAGIGERTGLGQGCPYCCHNARKVCECNSFAKKFPDLAKEWHPTKNKDLEEKGFTPFNLTHKSHYKTWWKCKKGHEYQAVISDRTRDDNRNISCAKCNGTVSYGEREIGKILDKLKLFYITQQHINVNGIVLKFDFYFPKYNKAIEFDGELHFRVTNFFGGEPKFIRTQEMDSLKNQYCSANKIHLLRIHWKDLKNAEEIIGEFIESEHLRTLWLSESYPI